MGFVALFLVLCEYVRIMDKFAVIETGGKQYIVREGDKLRVELLLETEVGQEFSFDNVLLIAGEKGVSVGSPAVAGASVKAEIKENGRAKKINVIRYKAKSRYFKKRGHRQPFTEVEIKTINS